MSKDLDLSEFEKVAETSPRPLLREIGKEGATEQNATVEIASAPKKSHEVGKYKFIPVGFSQRHLDMLDEAVYKLKKKGHLKASRSAIIRILIKRYAVGVIENYRGEKG